MANFGVTFNPSVGARGDPAGQEQQRLQQAVRLFNLRLPRVNVGGIAPNALLQSRGGQPEMDSALSLQALQRLMQIMAGLGEAPQGGYSGAPQGGSAGMAFAPPLAVAPPPIDVGGYGGGGMVPRIGIDPPLLPRPGTGGPTPPLPGRGPISPPGPLNLPPTKNPRLVTPPGSWNLPRGRVDSSPPGRGNLPPNGPAPGWQNPRFVTSHPRGGPLPLDRPISPPGRPNLPRIRPISI